MNEPFIIQERRQLLNRVPVGRLLPKKTKKSVGPFIFMDHIGPAQITRSQPVIVPQHPHIGLSTLTWLLQGSLLHKDSLGYTQIINPGSVNWMTAGNGIVHSEKSIDISQQSSEYQLHGFQFWAALPIEHQNDDPSFCHVPSVNLPRWSQNNIDFNLIVGSAFEVTSPVPVYSKMFMLQIKATQSTEFKTEKHLSGELGAYIVQGTLEHHQNKFNTNQLIIFNNAQNLSFKLSKNTHLILFGGDPLAESRIMDWNFVHTSKSAIEQAKSNWKSKRFKMVQGESNYMPYPDE